MVEKIYHTAANRKNFLCFSIFFFLLVVVFVFVLYDVDDIEHEQTNILPILRQKLFATFQITIQISCVSFFSLLFLMHIFFAIINCAYCIHFAFIQENMKTIQNRESMSESERTNTQSAKCNSSSRHILLCASYFSA